jgi:trigger factor
MKVVVNELDSCKRGLRVEVPGERVSEELERGLREMGRRARIPGFRQGRIPMEIVRQRFGKEVHDEVIERMVREYARRALEEKKLSPVQDPVLDEVHYESGHALTFRAVFDVKPVVSVTDYHRMAISVSRREVKEEMIDAALRDLAERAAKLEAVTGRPVQKGDYVVGTLSCRFVQGKGRNLSGEPLFLEAGAESNHPDFNAAILGMEAGASRSFETRYPDDDRAESLRGCTVAYTLFVKEIKQKVVPPINDELARELGNFQDLAELRDKVRKEIEQRARAAEQTEAKDRILAELVEKHPFDVPESLVQAQVDGRLEGIVREMVSQGMDPTKAPVDWRQEREKLAPAAANTVRAMLILEAIADLEGIQATEEDVNNWLREEARRRNASLPALKEQLASNARLTGLRRQIVREKTLDFLLGSANITHEGK